jgi:two-component system OmpR family sensor kinase
MSPPGGFSLRARLLRFLLAAVLLVALAQAFFAYRGARAEADAIFDYHMQQMALSLRARFPLSLMPGVADELGESEGFDFLVQVWTTSGLRIFRTEGVELPQRAQLGFSELQQSGRGYRVFAMQAGPLVIEVAQDMAARRRMAGAMALRTLLPVALLAPLLMLLVWWVVSSALAPVERARRQVAAREAEDLGEVAEGGLPDEVRPLVHELNLLLARVGRALEAQKSFVADAAHELRSPLAALKLQVQGLQRAPDEAARALAATRLAAGIERASRLVEQLLALARQQAGPSAATAARPLALAGVVRAAVADAAPAAQARHVDLGLAQVEELQVRGDEQALRILLRNLLDNAVKYTPEGGTVDVDLCALAAPAGAPPRVRLTVQDSGPGIAPAERARVLDRFYRVPGAAAGGSGLGLAIVKAIAQAHGASLELGDSERLGGLCVTVEFAAAP